MRRWLSGLLVGLLIGLIGVLVTFTPIGNTFEQNVGLRWLFKTRGAITAPAEAVVVAINGSAIEGLNLPPQPRDWSRTIHGRLVNQLSSLGASAIVFDMDFQRPKEAAEDQSFAAAVAQSERVVLFQRLEGKRQPLFNASGDQTGTVWVEEQIPPIPELANSARALAPFPVPKVQVDIFQFWTFKPTADNSGTLPSVALQIHALDAFPQLLNLLYTLDTELADSLPGSINELKHADDVRSMMQLLRQAFSQSPNLYHNFIAELSASHPDKIDSKRRQLLKALAGLYHENDNPHLNFYGPPGSIKTIPYNAVINASADDSSKLDFSNKVVFVGFSDLFDPGQPDRFYTVFTRDDGVDLSGVEIAATAFANLLTERTLQPSGLVVTAVLMLAIGLILGSLVFLLPALVGVPTAIIAAALYAVFAQLGFNKDDLWLPLATPVILQLPLAIFVGLFSQYLLERRKERHVSNALRYYLPENIAKQLTKEEIDVAALNQVVYGVCLATDMSGFTAISETMSPEKLAEFMNSYFDELATALNTHEVDVTEFHADTIMCAWTAQGAELLDRQKAVYASLTVVDAVKKFNQKNQNVNLNARIGLEEGKFYLGHTGGGGRMGYSILGNCANTAARLESLNKHLSTHILAAKSVVDGINEIVSRSVGKFVLVGKSDPIEVVEIMAIKDPAAADCELKLLTFAQALQLFEQHKWKDAQTAFKSIVNAHPEDGPSQFYLNLCRAYQLNPPRFKNPSVVHMDAK